MTDDAVMTINMETQIQNQPPKKKNCCLKIVIAFLALIFLGSIVISVAYFGGYIQRCTTPIKFAVGDVDPKFKVTKDQVIESAKDAANRWNQKSAKNWYEYDPNSSFKINLVYDERQAKLDQINSEVADYNASADSIKQRNERLKQKVEQYQKDLAEYNASVAYWNTQGGAPSDTYQQLVASQNSLDARREQINKELQTFNLQVDANNANLGDLTAKIDAEKNKIETQGEYKGDRIDVYTFGNQDELRLVLTHELGHALTTDHAQQSTSILYYLLADQDQKNPMPTDEDIALIKNKCKIK